MSNLADLKIEKGVPIPPDPEEEAGRLLDRLAEVGDSVVVPFGAIEWTALFGVAAKRGIELRQERRNQFSTVSFSARGAGTRIWRIK